MSETRRELQDVLLDYIERYGLTEKARQYFLRSDTEESEDGDLQPDNPRGPERPAGAE